MEKFEKRRKGVELLFDIIFWFYLIEIIGYIVFKVLYIAGIATVDIFNLGEFLILLLGLGLMFCSARLAHDGKIAAGIIGIILMFIYMVWCYRVMGWIANFALCFYIILFMFFLQAIPIVQLTLEGIAGIILSIGMAIDANIIIFERIKEEYAYGKRIEPSINAGFKRALPAILDSNITTILAAVILLIFGTGSIQGFAMTLLIGIVLSMFSSIVITRGLLKMYYPINSTNAKKYSLKREVASDVQK